MQNWQHQAVDLGAPTKEFVKRSVVEKVKSYFNLDPTDPIFFVWNGRLTLKMAVLGQAKYLDWKNEYQPHLDRMNVHFSSDEECLHEFEVITSPHSQHTPVYLVALRSSTAALHDVPQPAAAATPAAPAAAGVPLPGEEIYFSNLRNVHWTMCQRMTGQRMPRDEFNVLFNRCAYNSARIYGLPQTCNNLDLVEAIRKLILDNAERESLSLVDKVLVHVYTSLQKGSGWTKTSNFSVLIPGNWAATDHIFNFVISFIQRGELRIGMSRPLALDTNCSIPFRPMTRTMEIALNTWVEQHQEERVSTPPQQPLPGNPPQPPLTPILHQRQNFGGLCNNTWCVVEQFRIEESRRATQNKVNALRVSLQNAHMDKLIVLRSDSSRGVTVYIAGEECQLGQAGSEGVVYTGLFVAKKVVFGMGNSDLIAYLGSGDKEVKEVAVKVYLAGHKSKECDLVNMINSNRGVISYKDDVLQGPNQHFVQELGVMDLAQFVDIGYTKNWAEKMHIEKLMEEKLRIVRGICLAVAELHRQNVVHRDLRAPNVLIMDNGSLKICDFGLSRQIQGIGGNSKTQIGKSKASVEYNGQPYEIIAQLRILQEQFQKAGAGGAALQEEAGGAFKRKSRATSAAAASSGIITAGAAALAVKNDIDATTMADIDLTKSSEPLFDLMLEFSYSVDIFMLGCLIAFVIQGESPFPSNDAIFAKAEPQLEFANDFPGVPALHHLLSKMLSHTAEERPSIDAVLHHPFFQSWDDRKKIVENFNFLLYDGGRPQGNNAMFESGLKLLSSLEQSSEAQNWQKILYGGLPEVVKNKYPLTKVPTMPDGRGDHPLPNMTVIFRFIRNFMAHLRENRDRDCLSALQTNVPSEFMESLPGDFLLCSPATLWVFTSIWERHCFLTAEVARMRQNEMEKHQRNVQEFNLAEVTLDTFINKGYK